MDQQEVKYVFSGDLSNLADAVRKVSSLLDKISQDFKKTDSSSTNTRNVKSFQNVKKAIDSCKESISKTNKQTKTLSTTMQGLASVGNLVKKALAGIVGVNLGDWLAQGVKSSISFIENLNLFRVAMGDSYETGKKFVDQMSEVFGMDPSNLYRYAGYFYQLSDAIGMTDEASAVMSLSLTKAANDVASLFNVDINTVINNLASGMQGMTRAVRKYGIDIRAVTLQQTAFNYGITQQVETMSEADRMALRYITMMNQIKNATKQGVDATEQASGVMGDFARNIETPANQLRIFKEQISQLGRAIGNFFIPVLSRLLPILNGVAMAIRTVLTYIAALTGFNMSFGGVSTGVEDTAQAFENLENAAAGASAAAKELRKTLAPFDEINRLQAPNNSGGGGGLASDTLNPALLEALKSMSLSIEEIEMKANKVRNALLEFFGFNYVEVFNPDTGEYEKKLQWFADKFEENLIEKFPQWSKTITAIFDTWSENIDGFKRIWEAIGTVVDKIKLKIDDFKESLHLDDAFSTALYNLADGLNAIADWISNNSDLVAFIIFPIELLTNLFTLLNEVFESTESSLSNLWENTLKPVVVAIKTAIDNITLVVKKLWEEILGPIIQHISESVSGLFGTVLKPIITKIIEIVSGVIEIILALWNNVLSPIIQWLIGTLGPTIRTIVNSIWDSISAIVTNIGRVIEGLLTVLKGVIDFIAGVFTGDWERAWTGIKEIFGGIFNAIIGILAAVLNGIISGINSLIALVWGALQQFVNSIFSTINFIGKYLGFSIDVSWGSPPPAIGYVDIPPVAFANGGVVTGPTNALIGEGHYDEAVIPLGNSPQMQDLIDSIVEGTNNTEQVSLLREQNSILRQILEKTGVHLDGKEIADTVSRYQRMEARAWG